MLHRIILVLGIILLSVTANSQETTDCTEIVSGVVVTNTGKTEVPPGTYCTNAAAKSLAKKIVDLNTQIKTLGINLSAEKERADLSEKKNTDINNSWKKTVDTLETELLVANGWWRTYGKTILWCGVTAAATTATIYLLEKAKVVDW